MSNLKSILSTLCKGSIEGALVITLDGMVIETHQLDKRMGETLSAFMSQVSATAKYALKRMGHNEYTRYVITTSQGKKVYLVDLGKSVLIALADDDKKTAGQVNIPLFQAATEIKKTGRIDV